MVTKVRSESYTRIWADGFGYKHWHYLQIKLSVLDQINLFSWWMRAEWQWHTLPLPESLLEWFLLWSRWLVLWMAGHWSDTCSLLSVQLRDRVTWHFARPLVWWNGVEGICSIYQNCRSGGFLKDMFHGVYNCFAPCWLFHTHTCISCFHGLPLSGPVRKCTTNDDCHHFATSYWSNPTNLQSICRKWRRGASPSYCFECVSVGEIPFLFRKCNLM